MVKLQVTGEELNKVINDLLREKAVGLNGVSNELIKCLSVGSREYLRTFVNKCLEERKMPQKLKEGRVKLLLKGGDARDPKCYRLITVNSVLA